MFDNTGPWPQGFYGGRVLNLPGLLTQEQQEVANNIFESASIANPAWYRPSTPLPWPEFNRSAAEYFRRRADLLKKRRKRAYEFTRAQKQAYLKSD